ncbi:MAG: chloride channel protein [Oligoflexia bacterium]|nr:chloride channel protein [Oligoflexia bacterium]
MILRPLFAGLVASAVVALPRIVESRGWLYFPDSPVLPFLVVAVMVLIAVLVQRFVIERHAGPRVYQGLADLFFHIHTPSSPDSWVRWAARGLVSLVLAAFGGLAGAEGAALEFSHAFFLNLRSRTARWFEQRRRTEAACSMAAAVSAAFGAPFAAVLLPLELGIGGRTISVAVSALAAFIGSRYWADALSLHTFDLTGALYGFSFLRWSEWGGTLAIAVACGVAGAVTVRFIHYARGSLQRVLVGGPSVGVARQRAPWVRLAIGGFLIFLVAAAYQKGFAPSFTLLEDLLWGRRDTEAGVLFLARLLSLSLVISIFGTSGVFWPLFAMGGFVGFEINRLAFGALPGFSAAAGLIGASAFWSAVFGAPVAGAVLVFELSHNTQLVLPALLAGLVAQAVAGRLRTPRLIDRDLESRGLRLADGRSVSVLSRVLVRDAMVVDFKSVHEQQPVSELVERLAGSPYPFFPVVKGQGVYSGLLTLDVVQDALHTDQIVTSTSSLSKLLEVKDLLYRTGFRSGTVPTVRADQKLSELSRQLDRFPCLPVLGEDDKVIGLLLVQNVRLAYDREVARRSLEIPAP